MEKMSREIGPRIYQIERRFFTYQKLEKPGKNRAPNSTNRAPIFSFQQTSISHSKLQFWVTSTTVWNSYWIKQFKL